MILLKILSGKSAGSLCAARRFPFQVGRREDSDLRLEEDGVWERHLEIAFEPPNGFRARVVGDAGLLVNSQSVSDVILKNGDLLDVGAVKLRFWLGETTQVSFRTRELLTWLALGALCIGQIVLIYRLLQ